MRKQSSSPAVKLLIAASPDGAIDMARVYAMNVQEQIERTRQVIHRYFSEVWNEGRLQVGRTAHARLHQSNRARTPPSSCFGEARDPM
jgi:hypothetical protein